MHEKPSKDGDLGGLGAVERQTISGLAALERPTATADDLIRRFGISRQRANLALSRLARKGWLRRLRRGTYAVIPLSAESSEVVADDPKATAMELFAPCYISGWTAAEHWHLTEQVSNTVVVYSAKHERRASQNIGGITYRIRRVTQNGFFGTASIWSGTTRIQMATVHRTVIDILDAPEMGGGGRQTLDCVRAYWRRADADPDALLSLAEKLGHGSVFKRLGFVGELLQHVDRAWLDRCATHLTTGTALFDPRGPKTGPISTRWRIRMNVPLDDRP
ncbi:MAG TPA: type IV toxin-antitoxin system AbiEi family antitoxin domain-containing protein [Gemmatimonadales bacterium]|jgi:predicted transcriptional regulator of viral defense system